MHNIHRFAWAPPGKCPCAKTALIQCTLQITYKSTKEIKVVDMKSLNTMQTHARVQYTKYTMDM